jgi:hypothetical protein
MEQKKHLTTCLHKYSQLIVEKGAKEIPWSKDSFTTMVMEQSAIHMQMK